MDGTRPVSYTHLNDTLTLTEQDSGLTFRSYMDEEVVISGASKVDASAFKKVTDEAVLNRVVDKSARDKICLLYTSNFKQYIDSDMSGYRLQ